MPSEIAGLWNIEPQRFFRKALKAVHKYRYGSNKYKAAKYLMEYNVTVIEEAWWSVSVSPSGEEYDSRLVGRAGKEYGAAVLIVTGTVLATITKDFRTAVKDAVKRGPAWYGIDALA